MVQSLYLFACPDSNALHGKSGKKTRGKLNIIICPGIVQDVLNVVASAAICLAWIEIIFMIGRYPFLGGRFSIMFYSITKKIIQGIVSFIIMVIGFGFAFFVIRKGF